MRASEFTKQELDEKVNPRVVEPGFTAEKRLGNRYVMKAEARYTGEPGDDLRGLIIKVYDTKAKPTMLNWGIGMTRFVARQDPTTQDWYLVSSTTHVDDRYQRQGLASAMYNWARELGNDIEPSSNRTKMGKHFWEKGAGAGREFVDQPPETAAPPAIPTSTAAEPVKAQSLRDRLVKMFTEELGLVEDSFNGIDITVEKEDDEIMVRALSNGRELGHVLFVENGEYLLPQDLEVDERFRGQGIAQAMYDYVKSKGYKIRRSGQQTDAGAGFWNKHRAAQNVWEQDDSEVKSQDFMAGHCHVMALALKQLHPDWQIRAHVGYDDDAADDTEYRVDHVYTVAPDGTAYDCRGKFHNEQQLVGPDATGGVDTQYVNFGPEEIKQAMLRGELKRFTKQDLDNAMQVGKQVVAEGSLTEIENMKQSHFRGGKDTLDRYSTPGKKHLRALPGGSDLMYSITSDPYDSYVHILDPGIPGITKPSIVAGLSLGKGFIPNSVRVGSITVDENYRGRGLAKALYGIVLTIMKKTLISGDSQTPGGRRNWLSLASIPGVEIKGLLNLANSQLDKSRQVDNTIDQLMQLGGQFVARDNNYTYWAFDVVPGNGQLAPAVKNKLSKLYGYDSDNLLMATWTGGQQVVAEGQDNLSYIGNCTDDDVIEHVFGDATGFAQAVEEYGDEFVLDDLVVKYDPKTDVHSFYYQQQDVAENFADGRHPEDKGDSQRHGIPKNATMAELEKASHAAGRKGQLARWQLNMRRGHKK